MNENVDSVLEYLRTWRSHVLEDIRANPDDPHSVDLKIEIETALECLELCQKFRILKIRNAVILPDPQTIAASSEFRIIEDHECEKREHWTEVIVNGKAVRPAPGSVVIEPSKFGDRTA